ncbi:MAG: ABC transporter permease [Candidatus Aminicenantes bacterium]|nr:MAG: ABC transporter permease [Candidatus Aminicenantes bacterium]
MFKSYLLIALRNLKKQKAFSLINIVGMAIGMAGFTLFALMAGVKLRADNFHENADRIYSVVQVIQLENKEEKHLAFTPGPIAEALRIEFPEIEDVVRVYPAGKMILKRRDDSFFEENILFVDPAFLSMFSFKMAAGNPEAALTEPYSMVISEAAAIKYFGDEDPISKVLTLGKGINVTVTGVTRNLSRTSSIRFDFLVSMETIRTLSGILDDWSTHRIAAFLLVPEGFDQARFEERFPAFLAKYFKDYPESPQKMYLFPFLDFRLKSEHITSLMASSNPISVYVTLSIGVLLLVIVSINFINLSTVRYMHRTKEIGLRKVIGARRSQLIIQFLGESLLLSFIAIPAAILLYEIIHPIFYAYMGSFALASFIPQVSNSIWNYPFLLQYLVVAAILTGIFSGLYPAFFLSSFQPLEVLKESFKPGRKKKRGSKVMIVFQFSLSVIFIASAGILRHQFGHIWAADMGYNRERVAVIQLGEEAPKKLEVLKTEISRHPDVVQVSASRKLPLVWESAKPVRLLDMSEDEAFTMEAYGVDYGFVEAFEMQIKEGRSFSRDFADKQSFMLSETAVQKLEWENPLGKQLIVGDQTGTVIGVVKDFLFADIGFDIPPAVLYLEQENLNIMLVKFSSLDTFPDLRKFMKAQWQNIMPDLPFECMTLTEYSENVFGILTKIANFLNMIGLAAVLFSSLGLLGLATYLVERRTKEIGIRKVLGATSMNIMWKISKEFLLLVAIANVISLGLVYYGWQKALQTGLVFFTNVSASTYIIALLVTLSTAFLAVASQTLKAAWANPAQSLRYE